MGETGETYEWLGRTWAARGYWVGALTHRGSDRQVLEEEGIRGIIAATRRPETWRARFADISFLLDQIACASPDVPGVAHASAERVAVAGHSAGGLAACAVGGLQLGSVNFRDVRVASVISMSMPKLTAVVAPESWRTVEVPALHITGTLDASVQYWTFPGHRRIPFDNSAERGDQYLLTLRGGTHSTYSARESQHSRKRRKLRETVRIATSLFLDGWLKDDPAARASFSDGAHLRGHQLECR